ncbi:TSC22 domain family protein 1 isoform X3 [Crotalus tigris]|uniref:TSC22 domain family protein 1 isoform X3 n=1 Tax=Crotalus tigris TaxID=88082 RepID=UPI00192F76A4|nr:TSC22 domain family protein 1 isoform X3 [Crotalus tigris]
MTGIPFARRALPPRGGGGAARRGAGPGRGAGPRPERPISSRACLAKASGEQARGPARLRAAGEAAGGRASGRAAALAQRRRAPCFPRGARHPGRRRCCSRPAGGDGSRRLPAAALLHLLPLLPAGHRQRRAQPRHSSGASVVAIDNKIEQAMDLVKSHLMYAVREEVEVLKEQIKELIEKNNQLEQENNLLKTLASPEQLAQFQAQLPASPSPAASSQTQGTNLQPSQAAPPSSGPSA